MPRVGRNPMKSGGRPYAPQRVTLVTAVHIPEQAGYWEKSVEVLQVCLESVFRSTTQPYDLLVFDNGSCEAVGEYLRGLYDAGSIQFLIHSRENVGKVGCWNIAFPAAPGEYIAWFDSDVLFYPGWLEKSLEVFESFENVGMVTARPGRLPVPITDDILSATLDFAARPPAGYSVQAGDLIPRNIIADHFRSIGVDETSPGFPASDCRLTHGNVSAYAFAAHFQFVTLRATAIKLLPLPPGEYPLGADRMWDIRMNELGFLRLALNQAYVRHLGNNLDDADLAAVYDGTDLIDSVRRCANRQKTPDSWFARGIARRLLVRVHNAIGKLLFPSK